MEKEKIIRKIKQGAPFTSAVVVAACIGVSLSGYQAPVYEAQAQTKETKPVKTEETKAEEAQAKGFSERNPDADVLGYDACRKIAILSSLAFGHLVDFEDIYTEGITKITDVDFKYAKQLDSSIKLFASSKKTGDSFYAMVAPVLVNSYHPLYSVNDVLNGIYIKGNVIGDVMFVGAGAGKLPTASAVVSDVVDAVKHLGRNIMTNWSSKKLELTHIDKSEKQCRQW